MSTLFTPIEDVIKKRFNISTVKMEHLRSSAHYGTAMALVFTQEWDELEALLKRIQIITNRVDMRHTKGQS